MKTIRLAGDAPVEIRLRRSTRARRLSLRVSSLDGTGEPGFGAWQAVLGDGFYGWCLVKTLLVAAATTVRLRRTNFEAR